MADDRSAAAIGAVVERCLDAATVEPASVARLEHYIKVLCPACGQRAPGIRIAFSMLIELAPLPHWQGHATPRARVFSLRKKEAVVIQKLSPPRSVAGTTVDEEALRGALSHCQPATRQ